jgi:hypothetical protein
MDFKYPWELGPTPLVPPRPALRRRIQGIGRDKADLSISHVGQKSGFLILHLAWDFLAPKDRAKLCEEVSMVFGAYANLRWQASKQSTAELRRDRAPPDGSPVDENRSRLMAMALIRYDFIYGDFVRYLGGEYTNEDRDWLSTFDIIEAVQQVEPAPGYPPPDFDRASRLAMEGAPLTGHFECKFSSVDQRNKYDNHPGLSNSLEYQDLFVAKLHKEEKLSYQIVFPRFLWRFIEGLCLSPISFIPPKHEGDGGRACVDPTTKLTPDDDGAVNAQIPAPGTPGVEDRNPAVYYGTALV